MSSSSESSFNIFIELSSVVVASSFLVFYLESLSRGSRGDEYFLDGCEYGIGTMLVDVHAMLDNKVTVRFTFGFMYLDLIGVVVF